MAAILRKGPLNPNELHIDRVAPNSPTIPTSLSSKNLEDIKSLPHFSSKLIAAHASITLTHEKRRRREEAAVFDFHM